MTEKSYYERYWQKCLGSYGKGVAQLPPEWQPGDLERVLLFCKEKVKGRALDAGCGDGFFSKKLYELAKLEELIGIDISETVIAEAQTKYPDINFQCEELNQIPLDDSSCDFISFVEVIEHLVDVDGALKEVSRILKPGGILLVTTTDFNWLKSVIIAAFFFEKYFYPTNPHIRFFTKNTLTQILSDHGLSVIRYAWNGSYLGIMPKGQMVLAQKQSEEPVRTASRKSK